MIFQIGDPVKIKQGVRDPDFNVDLSHWQGTITKRVDAKLVCIEWDSRTLEQIPHDQIKTCEVNGWSWHQIHLELSDLEKASRRDTQNQVDKVIEKLQSQFFWAHLGEQGNRISTVLTGISLDDEVGALRAWANHLNNTITFPLKAMVTEIQFAGPLQSGDLVTIQSIMENYFDTDGQGLYVTVKTKTDEIYFQLSDLEVNDRKSESFKSVEDYVFWFSNR